MALLIPYTEGHLIHFPRDTGVNTTAGPAAESSVALCMKIDVLESSDCGESGDSALHIITTPTGDSRCAGCNTPVRPKLPNCSTCGLCLGCSE